LRRNVIAWLKRPRQMTTARFWRKWLRLGEWWLRRVRIKRVNSQPIAFRQHRLRVRQPDEATLVPCVAAKRALPYLRNCALTLSTLERSADTVPTLSGNNSPNPHGLTRKRCRRSILLARPLIVAAKKNPKHTCRLGFLSCCLMFRLI